jgi:hypothetical protein
MMKKLMEHEVAFYGALETQNELLKQDTFDKSDLKIPDVKAELEEFESKYESQRAETGISRDSFAAPKRGDNSTRHSHSRKTDRQSKMWMDPLSLNPFSHQET